MGVEKDSDIIELTDIAIGITPEDDAIVEQTEDLIGEAFVGFAGAISEVLHDDEQRLDLSETTPGRVWNLSPRSVNRAHPHILAAMSCSSLPTASA